MGATERSLGARERLLTPSFGLICGITAVTFFAFFLLLPAIPIYIKEIAGDESQVGLAMGVFSISSVLTRLFAGRQSDRQGKKYLVLGGLLLCAGATVLYSVWSNMLPLYLLRFAHGAGWGITTTAGAAVVADLAPNSRRGEAMGYYGIFSTATLSLSPLVAAWVLVSQGVGTVFVASAVLSIVAAVAALAMAEPKTGSASLIDPLKSALVSRKALFPSGIVFMLGISYAGLMTFMPLFTRERHLGNEGLFYTVFAVVMLATRPIGGALSDRRGRGFVIVPSLVAMSIALALLVVTWDQWALVAVAALTGIGFGGVQPTLMALTVDCAGAHERGAAMGTFTAAFDLGIGAGSVAMGVIVSAAGFGTMFAAAGLMGFVTLFAFLSPGRLFRRQT